MLKILFIMCIVLGIINCVVAGGEAYVFGNSKVFKTPTRIHSIIVSETGYYPSSIMMFKGEKLKLFVTGAQKGPGCLMIPEKNIFLAAEKGVITETEVIFDKIGTYQFFCPSKRNIKGKIVVMQTKEEADRVKRELASKNKVKKVWIPKEKSGHYK